MGIMGINCTRYEDNFGIPEVEFLDEERKDQDVELTMSFRSTEISDKDYPRTNHDTISKALKFLSTLEVNKPPTFDVLELYEIPKLRVHFSKQNLTRLIQADKK